MIKGTVIDVTSIDINASGTIMMIKGIVINVTSIDEFIL